MKLSEKIIQLRKVNSWSQEELAEKMEVSRQAISRWENGTALPDSNNLLQLSKLFNVTADYLLNEDYASDNDIPCLKEAYESLDAKKKDYGKASLIASIAFIIGAFAWLYQAINTMEIVYVILAVFNAILSVVNVFLYEKNRKKDK